MPLCHKPWCGDLDDKFAFVAEPYFYFLHSYYCSSQGSQAVEQDSSDPWNTI